MAKIFSQYKFGFSKYAFIAFLLQELPYLFWFLFPPLNNPLLNNIPQNEAFGFFETIGGIATVGILTVIVNKSPIIINYRNKLFLFALCCLGIYYICWICYFLGITNTLMLILGMTAIVPIYYFFISLWLKNHLALITSIIFLIGHTGSNIINYLL